jgi:hypothetical protein
MGLIANGFRDANGITKIWGATVSNNGYPSTAMGNHYRTGATRNILASAAGISNLTSLPVGTRHPNCWMMPQKPGALSAINQVSGSGTITTTALAVKLATADISGAGSLTALGGLIVQALADLSGSGDITDADIKAFLAAVASIGGTGGVSDAEATGLGELVCALTGLGTTAGSTATGIGELDADIVVTGTGLTTGNVGQAVWAAIAAANNVAGTMGEKLNDAGSASNPWTEVIESGYTAAEILRLLAAVAQGDASGLENGSPTFKSLDGSKDRVVGTYSNGDRAITGRDVT